MSVSWVYYTVMSCPAHCGLFRVRCFTQDDAHIFMTWDQMKGRIKNVVRLFDEVYSTFRSDLSDQAVLHAGGSHGRTEGLAVCGKRPLLRPSPRSARTTLSTGVTARSTSPKLDFHLADSIGRTWQCGTIQLDMQLPERSSLSTPAQTAEAPSGYDPPRCPQLHWSASSALSPSILQAHSRHGWHRSRFALCR